MNDKISKIIGITIRILAFIISAFIFILLLKIPLVNSFVKVIIISMFISYALKPLYFKMIKGGMKKSFSAAILILSLLSLCCAIIILLVPNLIRELGSIDKILSSLSQFINTKFSNIKLLKENYIFDNILKKLYDFGNSFSDGIIFYVMNIGQNLVVYCIIPIVTYYFLVDGNKILEKFLFLFSVGKRKVIRNVLEHIDILLSKYILSQVVLSVVICILTLIILIIGKISNPILLSVLNGILNIIPYFGPLLGAIPICMVAFLISNERGIIITILLIIIQQIEGDIISPKIIGEYVDLHPLAVIVLLILGGEICGFMGMIIAVPVGVIIKVVYNDINYYLY
ncbi:Predicted PurR-regulated permease PerM [Hathewaya proteolytica DSM 3090]|uniref:Predicted PurR-regulated permease PerM n=1 Tax=Hathewaya proteolytica DSM 3090 TaxID=1121331 RepID=A0A1M6JD33_9CLOT|nr:AI-2E family transporter [Hathewaya proteolytica]SHJ44635.1 Predicted PurR-regulated permease PerM [Hathewaya proteolytica DSM 3090]